MTIKTWQERAEISKSKISCELNQNDISYIKEYSMQGEIDELRAALRERECAYMEGFEAAKHEARDVIDEQRRIIETLNAGIGCATALENIRVLDERDELRAELAELEKRYPKSFAEAHPANHNATCKCEHWQSCHDCHPTAHTDKSTPAYNANCIRHPEAPHGVDVDASWRVGHTVCVCQSWTPGEAS